jgi:hypothetical protein
MLRGLLILSMVLVVWFGWRGVHIALPTVGASDVSMLVGVTIKIQSNGLCKAHGGGQRCQHAGGCNKHVVKKRLSKQHGKSAGVWD